MSTKCAPLVTGGSVVKICFMYLPLFVGVLCRSLFWYPLLCVISSIALILTRKRDLVTLHLLSFRCVVTVNVLWIFLMVPRVGSQYVIVVYPDHTHLLFTLYKYV